MKLIMKSRLKSIYISVIRGSRFQLQKEGLKSKLYLNVGCGPNIHENFINLDYLWYSNLDLCWDITKGIPLADNSLLGVFTEHCLEHVSYLDAYKVLLDFRRMLKPGGNLRIVVPDAELFLDRYHKGKLGEKVNFPNGLTACGMTPSGITPMMEINRVFRGHGHLFAYDYITLETTLKRAGFVDIRKESFMRGRDSALVIDSEHRAYSSLYVEASVPNQVLQPNLNNAEAYYNQSTFHLALGKYKQVIEDSTQALYLNPSFAEVYYNRGTARAILRDKQGAIEDLQKAAELFSEQGKMDHYQQVQDYLVMTLSDKVRG